MTWTAERTTVNQRIQIAPEATTALGTAVAATKVLQCFDFVMGINGDISQYTPTGRKYVAEQEENTEWVDITVGGDFDYNGVIYPLASAMGSVAPASHGASSTAKDWIFTPPTSGSIVPQTYTMQQGDSVRAQQVTYGLFTQFGYKGTRKDFTVSGKMIAQPITDGATMTASPTAIALAPVVSKQVNVYLDTTSAGLGTTQLQKVLSVDYSMDNIYGPLWVFNRANVGYTAHVDLMPKSTIKLKVEADAAGMALLGYLQSGTTYYLRVSALGAVIDTAINNTFQHDMAIKVGKPSTYGDDQGVFAIEWECTIVEDFSWGKSQLFTVTNLLTAL
jgi:hypothetical protein